MFFMRSTTPSTRPEHSRLLASSSPWSVILRFHRSFIPVPSLLPHTMMTERALQQGCLDHARRDTDIPTTIITGRMPATISPIEERSAGGGPEVEVASHRRPFKKRLRDIHKVKHSFRLIDDDDDDDEDDADCEYDSSAASHPPSLERRSASVYAVTESHQVELDKQGQVSCRTIPRVQSWKSSGPPPLCLQIQRSNQSVPIPVPVPVPVPTNKSHQHQSWSSVSRKSHRALYPSLKDLADCCEYQWKQQEVTAPRKSKSKSDSFRKKACPSPTKKQCKKGISSSMITTTTTTTTSQQQQQQQHQPTPTRVTPTEHSFAVVERPPQHPAGQRYPLPKQRSSLALAEPKECSRTSFEKLQQKSESQLFSKDHRKNSQDRRLVAPRRHRSVRLASTTGSSSKPKLVPPIETHHDEASSDDEESEVEFEFQLPKFLRTKNGRDNDVSVSVSVQAKQGMMDILVIPPRQSARQTPTPTSTQKQSQSQSQSQSQRDIVFSPPQSTAKKMPPLAINARMTSICPKVPPSACRSAKPSVASGVGRRPLPAHGLKSPPPSSIDARNLSSSSQREICFPGAAGPPKIQLKSPPPFVGTTGSSNNNHALEIQLADPKQPPPHQQYVPSTSLQKIRLLPSPRQSSSASTSQKTQQRTIPVDVHREIRVLPASHHQIIPPAAASSSSRMRHSISSPQDICLPGAQTQQHHAYMIPPQPNDNNAHRRGSAPVIAQTQQHHAYIKPPQHNDNAHRRGSAPVIAQTQQHHAYMKPPQHNDNAHRRGSAPVIVSSEAAPTDGPLLSSRPSPGCNKPSSDRYFSPTNNHQMVANIYPPFSPLSASRRSAFVPPKAAEVFAPPAVNAFAPRPAASSNINTKMTNKFPTSLLCTPLSRRVSDLSMSSFQGYHEKTMRRCFPDQRDLFEF